MFDALFFYALHCAIKDFLRKPCLPQGGESDPVLGQIVDRVDVGQESIPHQPSRSKSHAVSRDQGRKTVSSGSLGTDVTLRSEGGVGDGPRLATESCEFDTSSVHEEDQ